MKTKGFGRALLIAGGAASLCLACTNSYFDNVKKLVDEKTNGPAAAPVFSPAPGNYSTDQSVAISCPTGGAVIFYTTDGSTPTASSPVYAAPVLVAGPATTKTIRAFARRSGFQDSVVASATYVVNSIAVIPPTMTPTGGRLGHAVPVTLSCATPGATIVYTLDESFPAESGGVITHGTQYTAPFILPYGNTTVTAMAFRVGDLDSAMAFGIFTEPVFLYVGSTVFSSNVTALQVNLASGIPSFVGAYTVGAQVQTVAADPAGRYLFSSATLPATTNSFAINPSTGALVAVNDVPMGTNFVSAVVEATGQYLYSSTSIASGPTGYTINQSTGSVTQIATFASAGFTTGMAADPVGPYLYVALSNTGQVQGYHVNTATGQIDTIGTFTGAIGTSSVVVDPTGRFLYAGNPGSGSVSAFTINSGTGILTGNGSVAAGAVAAVAVDPSGRFLYVADSSLSAIYAFAINPATGTLGPVAGSPYPDAAGPVSLSVEPSGQFLYVAHTGSTFLTIFRVDSGTGVLSGIGNYNVGATQTSITSTGVAQ